MTDTNDNPLVSIDCIAFKHEAYVAQALEGMLAQDAPFGYEILVHDDASPDRTPEIIAGIARENPDRVFPILQTENKWSKGEDVSIRYNLGRARGKYLAFCEGDDYWTDPAKLRRQVEFLEANPDHGMVHTGIVSNRDIADTFSEWGMAMRNGHVSGDVFVKLFCGNFISTPTVMVRTDAFRQAVGTLESLGMGCTIDYWFWLEIARTWKVGFLPEATAFYRNHCNGLSHNTDFMVKKVTKIWETHFRRSMTRRHLRAAAPEELHRVAYQAILLSRSRDLGRSARAGVALKALTSLPPRALVSAARQWRQESCGGNGHADGSRS